MKIKTNSFLWMGWLCAALPGLMACGPEYTEENTAQELVEASEVEQVQSFLTEPGNILTGEDRYTHPYYASGGRCVFETTLGTLPDSVMWLYGPNSTTNFISYDDDSGAGYASRIEGFLHPGTYYATVGAYSSSQTGDYIISMNCYSAVRYQSHVASLGWMGWVYDGNVSGTTGQSRRMEAIRVWLTGTCG